RLRLLGGTFRHMGGALEAFFANVVARLNLDETDFEPRVAVAGEGQGAGDMNRADAGLRLQVVADHMSFLNLDLGALAGNLTAFPGRWGRPGAALGGAVEWGFAGGSGYLGAGETPPPHAKAHGQNKQQYCRGHLELGQEHVFQDSFGK